MRSGAALVMLAEVFVVGHVSRHIHLLHQLMNGVVSISQKTLVGDLKEADIFISL